MTETAALFDEKIVSAEGTEFEKEYHVRWVPFSDREVFEVQSLQYAYTDALSVSDDDPIKGHDTRMELFDKITKIWEEKIKHCEPEARATEKLPVIVGIVGFTND